MLAAVGLALGVVGMLSTRNFRIRPTPTEVLAAIDVLPGPR
jgi:hypothetical protein